MVRTKNYSILLIFVLVFFFGYAKKLNWKSKCSKRLLISEENTVLEIIKSLGLLWMLVAARIGLINPSGLSQ